MAFGALNDHDEAIGAGRVGFFTDTSICIGCKACEVACKEWNALAADGLSFTGMSYDNTLGLGADTWRHVAFVEQRRPLGRQEPGLGDQDFRWLMASDVCKHCTHAACLDVCPTGSLFRTEYGTVVVQEDVCNGCGYCVPACPFGVIGKRERDGAGPGGGTAAKCTMCYDRLGAGQEPACAKTCPTDSIQFGDLDELRERAERRLEQVRGAGVTSARLYGHDPGDGVGGAGAFFLLLDEPEVYGLPPDPVVTTRDLPSMWRHAGVAALALLAGAALASWTSPRPSPGPSAGLLPPQRTSAGLLLPEMPPVRTAARAAVATLRRPAGSAAWPRASARPSRRTPARAAVAALFRSAGSAAWIRAWARPSPSQRTPARAAMAALRGRRAMGWSVVNSWRRRSS